MDKWEEQLSFAEFAYNNSYQASIGMAPYEALYGRPCRSPLYWAEKEARITLGPSYLRETTKTIRIIQERLKAAQSRQKSYTDRRRRPLEFMVGDFVFLKVTPMRGVSRFGVHGIVVVVNRGDKRVVPLAPQSQMVRCISMPTFP